MRKHGFDSRWGHLQFEPKKNMYNKLAAQLTEKQIRRQDFVDNEVFELMQKLLPRSKKMKWDIEAIGAIRDAIREQIVNKQKIVSEEQFYPYLKI